MKCPKCQYLGFDGQTRCRHCGYDLSLAATAEADAAATIRDPDTGAVEPLTELAYRPESSARAQARAAIQKRQASRAPSAAEAFDLPLFATPGVDDRPVLPASRPPLSVRRPVADAPRARAAAAAAFAPAPAVEPAPTQAAEARAAEPAPDPSDVLAAPAEPATPLEGEPAAFDMQLHFDAAPTPSSSIEDLRLAGGTLARPGQEPSSSVGVARAPDAVVPPHAHTKLSRARAESEVAAVVAPATADPMDAMSMAGATAPVAAEVPAEPEAPAPAETHDDGLAPVGRRMAAGLIDVAVLGVVDAAVVFATLRATGLELGAIDRLPVAPLVVFLLLLAMGYLTMCTVLAGRTFGKSLLGLSVVERGGRPVRLAPAVVRAAIQVVTVPAAGIGFLPALVGADRRALYDRLAGTDVIREPGARFPAPAE